MRCPVPKVAPSLILAFASLIAAVPAAAGRIVDQEAIVGEPFGVGRIVVRFEAGSGLAQDSPVQLVDAQSRTLYPAFDKSELRESSQKGSSQSASLTVYFLFRGNDPLRLELLTGDSREPATVTPVSGTDGRQEDLLDSWWMYYQKAADNVVKSDAYQPLVENYLTATLSRQLGLEMTKPPSPWHFWKNLDEVFALISGAESVRIAAQTEVLLKSTEAVQLADRPLPKAAAVPPVELPDFRPDEVTIEPIAMHVPVECFYIRCGSFANFTWLKAAVDDWGTNLRHLISVRGLDFVIGPRIERQLALKETVAARLFGDTVISDAAILGTDTFLREGAAIGILFEARNSSLLEHQISQQRQEALKRENGATEQTVRLAGRNVSLIATPDNAVRSFYAIDGNYHLVTTSRTIAGRFIEAGQGNKSLGRTREFRWARSTMPVADDHTVFIYLSDPFFNRLIGPHYRIEMTRRVRAASEIDVVRLARLAARAEGEPAETVEQLIARDLLPKHFGRRPDGSRIVIEAGRLTDSLRGAYGSFLPVPDVEISGATPSEVEAYKKFADRYAQQWRRMDPVVVGVKRRTLDDGAKERLIVDVHATPYARMHYGLINALLRPADKKRWAGIPGDILWVQVNLQGVKLAAGLRDQPRPFTIENGRVQYPKTPDDEFPSYLIDGPKTKRAWHIIDESDGPPDEDGDVRASSLAGGKGWVRKLPDCRLWAANKELLREVAPHVKLVDAERSAKGRLRIGDPKQAKMAAAIDAESYIRARKVSAGNAAFMHALTAQLRVPAGESRAVAEELLGAKLVCPLAGKYQLTRGPSGLEYWHSTGWAEPSLYAETVVPSGFRAPLLDWFAGVLFELDIDNTSLSSHIELDVRTKQASGE